MILPYLHERQPRVSAVLDHSRQNFRSDINGLRAWAVVAVVLYHFGMPGMQGGFIGVDVFFVISGFLMMGIIVNSLDRLSGQGDFSLLSFYLARARRIVPALIVLCVTLLVLGWFFMMPTDYRALSSDLVTALIFLSNFKFWREAGYFDASSHEKWFLHTWSLSVEWQFYLILPLVLMGLWRLSPSRRAMSVWLIAGFVVSLALSIILTPLKSMAAFYLLPTRAWEMLAGSLVFMLADRLSLSGMSRRIMELAGFVLILGSIAFIDSSMQWPGWRAMLPVAGAVLVLMAARIGSLWTCSHVAQSLGNASYSIYLWHWPVVVGLAYADSSNNPWAIGAGLLTSLLLGQASYRWVEQPSRQYLAARTWKFHVVELAGLIGLMIVAAGLAVYLKNGMVGQRESRIKAILAEIDNVNPRRTECHKDAPDQVPECTYGGKLLGVIVMGDSHAASVVRSVEKVLPSELHVLDWTYAGCPTLKDVRWKGERGSYCGNFVRQAILRSDAFPAAPLLIVNRYSLYINGWNEFGLEAQYGKPVVYFDSHEVPNSAFLTQWHKVFVETACEFAQSRPVYMMRPIPELRREVPRTMARAVWWGHDRRVSISLEEYHARHRLVWEAQDAARAQCGVHILDPLPYLCSDGRCWGDKDGMPLYYDDDHLSERGAALLQPLFETMLKQ